jgi:glutaredoxin
MTPPTLPRCALRPLALAVALCATTLPAWALYKVVQPDGSVTYTDRPPATTTARITALGKGSTPTGQADVAFPLDLRQATQRYPVVLYTSSDCTPCDAGRRLLAQRGVPYTERRIVSEEDAQMLERLAGGRTVPSLTIGAQPVRGLSETDWTAYLDAAGYPRESRLPRGWQAAPAAPLAERVPVPAARPAPPPADTSTIEPVSPGGVRF